ncbi:hypothetical protein, partial [Xanthomonas citri]|uniref:hypothetical protein n=1 Tax=Xanthomonas citri TaxID=346 RepID=UPI001B80AC02
NWELGIGGELGDWRPANALVLQRSQFLRCCTGDTLNRCDYAIPAFNASRTSLLRTTCSDIAGSRAGRITVLPARSM